MQAALRRIREEPLSAPRERRVRRLPAEASQANLERAALHYLERYAAPAAQLRRVLLARVERAARAHGSDREEGVRIAEGIVAKLIGQGLLDDHAYATAMTRSLRRRGLSAQGVHAKLAAKGVPPALIAESLADLDRELDAPELAAAVIYARRRRLGPYRRQDRSSSERDLAALARAGFDYDTARRVIEADDLAALEEEAERASTSA